MLATDDGGNVRMNGIGGRRAGALVAVAILGGLAGSGSTAFAQGESTPIRSPQDAACRNEARAKVFATPDPRGLGPYAIGRQIYMACMRRAQPGPTRRPRR